MMSTKEFIFDISIGTIVTFLLGDLNAEIKALFIFFLINLFLGVIKGITQHSLSSKKFIHGVFKGVCIFFMLIIGHQVDMLFPGGVGGIVNYRGIAIGFYIVYLLISILENYAVIGMPFPKKFKQVLEVIKDEAQ